MTIVIDRRDDASKGTANRERLIRRTKESAKQAVRDAVSKGNITDIGKDGVDVIIPKGGLNQHRFQHGAGGLNQRVLPGNNNPEAQHHAGDRLPRSGGGGSGSGGPGKGDKAGSDEGLEYYHLSEKEALDILFDDLALPNMIKKTMMGNHVTTLENAGFSKSGPFNRLNFVRSKKEKSIREMFMNRGNNLRLIELLEEEKAILLKYAGESVAENLGTDLSGLSTKGKVRRLVSDVKDLKSVFSTLASPDDTSRIEEIESEVTSLESKRRMVSRWREKSDLRFRAVEEEPVPHSKAAMFCVMDVSGSMDKNKKDLSKLFYFLLYRFLQRHYQQTDIVFIVHHTSAQEVDEEKFFGRGESGGTALSSGILKTLEIIKERYSPAEWNLYCAQASDGDNFDSDKDLHKKAMREILPILQGFFYTEVKPLGASYYESSQQDVYKTLAKEFSNLWVGLIEKREGIVPLFRDFFKKRSENSNEMVPRSAVFGPG
jgi:uncharacterized sporulation protein YeaH/YhbH (DUF444 family)